MVLTVLGRRSASHILGRNPARWRVSSHSRGRGEDACRSCQRWSSTYGNLSTEIKHGPVLRFAPSPTGQLHLGGLRTALFNQLFARKMGGRWILRIEDTDTKRLVPGAVEAMQDILAWAGLQYDEGPDRPGPRGPYVQSQRLDIYSRYAESLLKSGNAYRDFREARDTSQSSRSTFSTQDYIPPSEDEALEMVAGGRKFVVRMRLPHRKTMVDDTVYGSLAFPYDKAIDDPIIVKSDGWPTYHLANIVDDAEMGITHVLRGEEWLPSIPIHLALYEALGLTPPRFAHLPLLINPDGSKLSKRHADVHVESYRQAGYEPEALLNFVALMGSNWHASSATGDADLTSEVFSISDMVQRFTLERISHSRATPNVEKLYFLNRQHLRRRLADHWDSGSRDDLLLRLAKCLNENAWPGDDFPHDRLKAERLGLVADVMLERSHSLPQMVQDLHSLFTPPDLADNEAASMRAEIDDAVYGRALHAASEMLSDLPDEKADDVVAVDDTLKSTAKHLNKVLTLEANLPSGGSDRTRRTKWKGRSALLKPLRYALTGRHSGPTVAETIALLGKERSAARVAAALQ